jgi:hypothetical protein
MQCLTVTSFPLRATFMRSVKFSHNRYNRIASSTRGLQTCRFLYCATSQSDHALVYLLWMVHENLICTAVHQSCFLTTQEIRLVCFLEYEVQHLKHKNLVPKENYTNLISQKLSFLWRHRGFLGGSCRFQRPIWCGSIDSVNHIFTCYLIEYVTIEMLSVRIWTARMRVSGVEKVFWNE